MSADTANMSLGSLISVLSGYPFASAQFTDGLGTPVIRIRDLIGGKTETNFVGDFDPAYLIQRDDVLIGMDGDFNVVRWPGPQALLNQRVCRVRSANKEVDERFLFWWLQPHIQLIHRRTPQTTVRHLSVGHIYRIPKPNLRAESQAFAATVLDTVDRAIAKAENVIAKLRHVRTGLLHDLLTYGVDEHGELRDPLRHPEQFEDSPLGQIPKNWTAAPLRQFLTSAEYGISTSLSSKGSLPVLRMNNLLDGEACLEDMKFATCDVPAFLLLRVGDVLFNRTNSYEHVGRTGIWRGQLPRATFASYLVRLNPAADRLTSEFLNLILNMPETQIRMRRYATPAVQQVNINPTQLQLMHIAAPRLVTEQERITTIVNESARSIAAETSELVKMHALKSGLMIDLLTGCVSVPETIGVEA